MTTHTQENIIRAIAASQNDGQIAALCADDFSEFEPSCSKGIFPTLLPCDDLVYLAHHFHKPFRRKRPDTFAENKRYAFLHQAMV